MRQAALGLQHAHEQALVHRDIKPSNLMVTPTADRLRDPAGYRSSCSTWASPACSQLRRQRPGDSLSTLTQGGAVIGTADYVAPEQLEDPHGADIRADLYSLGCTFYFLLTGQVPFPGGSLISSSTSSAGTSRRRSTSCAADVAGRGARVVDELMAKKPADRFQTPGASWPRRWRCWPSTTTTTRRSRAIEFAESAG